MFTYTIEAQEKTSRARTGVFETPHGILKTPNLATVATSGAVKGIPKEKLSKQNLQLLIVNTFHLHTKGIIGELKPGETIHHYAGFEGPIESDSGGFQVFSLGFAKTHNVGKIGGFFPGKEHKDVDVNNPLTITDEGVSFTYDNRTITLSPEISIELQKKIGADIIFAFDECTSPLNSYEYTKEAMERTHRWLKRSITAWKTKSTMSFFSTPVGALQTSQGNPKSFEKDIVTSLPQALFAIVQGGYFKDLREISAKFVGQQDVPGFGIGGSLGKTKEEMLQVLDWTIPHLPDQKPRHLLGIGQVKDIFEAVERGVDLFDCVIPTREARHRLLYTKQGKLELRKNKHREEPIEKDCDCEACINNITMKQLWELFLAKDPLAHYFSTVHNVRFFSNLMNEIRNAIRNNIFAEVKNEYLALFKQPK